jgi:hypothetical protein
MLSKHEQQQLQRDLQLREAVIRRNTGDAIREAIRRLCYNCAFYNSEITSCGLMPLMLPLTLDKLDCPYYLLPTVAK